MILERLGHDGKVVVADLSSSLDVSLDTVRRDLQELADAGLVRRVHGGALPPAIGSRPYAIRREQAPAAKAAIASATAGLLRDGQVILLDAGTTTLEVARHLPERPAGNRDHEQPSDRGRPGGAPRPSTSRCWAAPRQGLPGARRRGDRRRAALRPGGRADPRCLQPAPRVRDHGARPRGVVRQARDDRERRRGRRGLLRGEARLRRALRRRIGRRAHPPRHGALVRPPISIRIAPSAIDVVVA